MKLFQKGILTSVSAILLLSSIGVCGNLFNNKDQKEKSDSSQKLSFGNLVVSDYENLIQRNYNSLVLNTIKLQDEPVDVFIELVGDTESDAYLSSNSKKSIKDFIESNEGIQINNNLVTSQAKLANKLLEKKLISSVNYNYTILFNGFSATTTYGNLEEIQGTLGVKSCYYGTTYSLPETISNTTVESSNTVSHKTKSAKQNNIGCDIDTGIAVNDSTYKGQGMVVAVLDSGLDYKHPAFANNVESPRYSKSDIANLLKDSTAQKDNNGKLSVDDVYISEKVPFAYDYADDDTDVLPVSSDHGTHVSGIITGYENGKFSGVAPEAQLVFMKVFSDEAASAKSDVVIRALEDCILLDVDAINESLGSVSGFSREAVPSGEVDSIEEKLNVIYDRVHELGISSLVSAGNDYSQTQAADDGSALTTNPDYGCVGSPGSYTTSLTVASVENGDEKTPYGIANSSITFSYQNGYTTSGKEVDFLDSLFAKLDKDANSVLDLEYVAIPNLGNEEDYEGLDVEGKIAVIRRGTLSFEDKIHNAKLQGAIGCIIYNNVAGQIRMTCGTSVEIPSISIENAPGEEMAGAKKGTLSFSKSYVNSLLMSNFSSIGPNPDLELKPEITSCGGNVLSSVIGGKYEKFSGTSMSCPNMSGIMLVIRAYVQDNWERLTGKPISQMTKVGVTTVSNQIVMSTTNLCFTPSGLPYSPRKQGAGMASITNALDSTAYIYVDDSDKTKIELKDDKNKTGVYELEFNIRNVSDSSKTYTVNKNILTETASFNGKTILSSPYELNPNMTVTAISNASCTNDKVTIAANSTGKIKIKLSLTAEEKKYLDGKFPNGIYVEGFIRLVSDDASDVEIGIPFLAFYGDWLKAPVFDKTLYDIQTPELYDEDVKPIDREHADLHEMIPYGRYGDYYMIPLGSYVYSIEKNGPYEQIMASEEKASISLTKDNIYDFYMVYGGLLRNAKSLTTTITDANTGEIIYSDVDYNVMKDSYYQSSGSTFPFSDEIKLSASEKQLANNTKYLVTLTANIDYENGDKASNNTKSFSFWVDYEAPTISDVQYYKIYDDSLKAYRYYVDLTTYDNRYVMDVNPCVIVDNVNKDSTSKYAISSLTKSPIPVYQQNPGEDTVVTVEITDYLSKVTSSVTPDTMYFYVEDYAMNSSLIYVSLNGSECKDLTLKQTEISISPNEVVNINDLASIDDAMLEGFSWTSTQPNVAACQENEIYGLTRGITYITGNSSYGVSIRLKVKVLGPNDVGYQELPKVAPEKLEFTNYKVIHQYDDDMLPSKIGSENSISWSVPKELELYLTESIQLSYKVSPWYADMTGYSIQFNSDTPSVAKVLSTGKVLTSGEGTSTITCRILKNGKRTTMLSTIRLTVQPAYNIINGWLTSYKGLDIDVNIPNDNNDLKYIGTYAFSHYNYYVDANGDIKQKAVGTNIRSVYIPDGVETINASAFENCKDLETVSLPSSLKEILESAFKDCSSLKTVTIRGEDSQLVKIDNKAFQGCSSLTDINLSTVSTIGNNSFEGCTSLTSVDISNQKFYGHHTFANCTSLSEVTLSDVTAIATSMFENTKLTSLVINNNYISKKAFANIPTLTSVKIIGDNVKIYEGAFVNCSALENVDFSEVTTSLTINANAFKNTAITSLTLPSCNVTLDRGSFSNKKLESLVLNPNTIINLISDTPFSNDSNFASITVNGTNPNYVVENNCIYSSDKATLILVAPKENVTIPSTVTTIGNGAFGSYQQEELTLPANVTKLGSYCFSNSNIKTLNCNGEFESINDYAFANTISLETIANYASSTIPNHAFENSAIKNISFANNVTIEEYAFSNISSLSSVTFLGNATIKDYAFYNSFASNATVDFAEESNITIGAYSFANTSLSSIDLSKVTAIGEHAFDGNTGIKELSISTLAPYTFSNCTSLEKVTLLNDLTNIPSHSFDNDIVLSNVVNLNKVTSIADYAFASCKSLKSIDLTNVDELGVYAFAGNTSLDSVILSSSLTIINEGTFYNNTSLKTINLSNIETVGSIAFENCSSLSNVNLSACTKIENEGFAATSIINLDLPECTSIGDLSFFNSSIKSLSIPNVKYIGNSAFANTRLTKVDLPTSLTKLAQCSFSTISTLETFTHGNEKTYKDDKNNWFITDGVLYLINDNGTTQLEVYPAKKTDTSYTILEDTTRIQEFAFMSNSYLESVTLPSKLISIGDSAFYDTEKLINYNFLSIKAPVLEGYYSSNLVQYLNSLDSTDLPESLESLYKYNYFLDAYFYSNFNDYLGINDLQLNLTCPENGINYNSFLYSKYFANANNSGDSGDSGDDDPVVPTPDTDKKGLSATQIALISTFSAIGGIAIIGAAVLVIFKKKKKVQ